MPRLDARWDNFDQRGFAWDHFWSDANNRKTGSFTADAVLIEWGPWSETYSNVVGAAFKADAIIRVSTSASLTADAVLFRTQTGSFTANAILRRTQAASLTADAVLKRTQAATFTADAALRREASAGLTANATIVRSQSASFTVDAVIVRTPTATLTADAVLRRQQAASLTADAVIIKTSTVTFTADSVIKKTQTGSFTANATIMPVFRVDAVIKKTVAGSFTADAYIAGAAAASFTANAFLAKLIEDDDFNRTVAEGFGRRYRNVSYTPLESDGEVNGSEAISHATSAETFPGYETQSGYHRPRTGYFQFDFWVPANRADESFYYGIDSAHPSGAFEPAELELYHSGTGNVWAADIYPSDLYYEFTPTASTWYTIKGFFESADGGVAAIKVWKRSDPEPHAWSQEGLHGAYPANPAFWRSHFYVDPFVTSVEDAKVDNLKAWTASTEPWEFQDYFRLDAYINDLATYGSFTANAVRKKTISRTFTADAYIILARVTGSFTADAVRKQTGRTGSFTANAYVYDGFGSGSFTANAIIYFGSTGSESTGGGGGTSGSGGSGGGTVPGGGGGGSGGSLPQTTIAILYDGVDITDDVDIAATEFTSMTNGNTGTARVRVLDTGHGHTFTTGKSLTLDIDGRRYWGGYVMQASKAYPFPVLNTTTPGTTARYWDLVGYDYAFLFERRIIYSPVHPKQKTDWTFPAGTYDDTIINTMFDSYIPGLAGDGLSRSGVQRVDIAILDIPGVTSGVDASGHRNTGGTVASAGFTWRQMMDSVARATGAVYYISATKVLHYADVDTADTAYILTDQPSLPVDVGYQKMALNYSGTQLVNDYLLWGAGLGVAKMTFEHLISNSSVTTHNRWQAGNFNGALYRQTSVDLAASTVINGTPQNKRGHKDDAVSFTCTVFVPVLHVGQKVRVISSIYGFDDVIPIRMMRITFANLHQAIFELTLSHSIDEAWSTFESFWPRLALPKVPNLLPPPPPPPPPPGGCDDATCGITDTFTRVLSGDVLAPYGKWGVSDAGVAYAPSGSYDTGWSVDGARGLHAFPTITSSFTQWQAVQTLYVDAVDMTFDFELSTMLDTTHGGHFLRVGRYGFDGGADVTFIGQYSVGGNTVTISSGSGDTTTTVSISGHMSARIQFGSTVSVKVWPYGEAEPGAWMVQRALSGSYPISVDFQHWQTLIPSVASYASTLWIDNLDITGVNQCSAVQFEDFNRTVSNALGTAAPAGSPWGIWSTSGGGSYGVDGASAYVNNKAIGAHADGNSIWSGDFTLTARIKSTNIPAPNTVTYPPSWDFDVTDTLGNSYVGGFIRMTSSGASGQVSLNQNVDEAKDFITSVQKNDWVANQWYIVKLRLEGTTSRIKVWAEGSAEPGWMVEQTLVVTAPRDTLYLYMANSAIGYTDYIDFDYDGRPCFSDCTDGVGFTDSFQRTVSANQTSAGTSDVGKVWSVTNAIDGADAVGVTGGAMAITATNRIAQSLGSFDVTMPWTVEFGLRFNSSQDTSRFMLDFANQNLRIFRDFSSPSVVNIILNGSGYADPLTLNVWYTFRLTHYTNGSDILLALQWWPDGDPDPGAPTGGSIITETSGTSNFVIELREFDTAIASVSLRELRISGATACVDVLPTEGYPQVPSSGLARETLAYAGGTNYYTTFAYQAGSTEVFVNGLRSPRGTGGYSESGPTTGVISFYSPLTASDIVTISYQSQGPTNA